MMNTTMPKLGIIFLPDWYDKNNDEEHMYNQTDNVTSVVREKAISVYQISLPIIFGIIIIAGLIGNSMVITVIAMRKQLHTVTNYLIMNLAVADVAFLVICGPIAVTHYALKSWPLGNAMCQTIQFFLYVTCYVTIYTLVTIAVVRYMLTVRMSSHPCIKKGGYILWVIIGIWCLSCLINIPVPLSHGAAQNPNYNNIECVISCPSTRKLFYPLFFVFSYFFPLLVLAVLYILLVHHLWLNNRKSMVNKPTGNRNEKSSKTGSAHRSRHVTRLLILVVFVFALCWLPLHVHLLWGTFGKLPHKFTYRMWLIICHALVFLNSALNPIIYSFFSSEFSENFKQICKHGTINDTSTSSSGSRGLILKQKNSSLLCGLEYM